MWPVDNSNQKRQPSRWYWYENPIMGKHRRYASPLRDNYIFESRDAEALFDYVAKRDGPPETERDLQYLLWYCGYKYGSKVTTLAGEVITKPETEE